MLGKSLGLDLGSHSIKIVELRQNLRTVEVARLQAVHVANGDHRARRAARERAGRSGSSASAS